MKKNVAGQKVGAQLTSASDGSSFAGTVTVYVTGDAGTQALGSVGAGVCTNEGNGYYTYAPAQAETNYDLIAFTFIGAGAVAATVQVYCSFPQTTDNPASLPNAGALTNLDAAVSSRLAPTVAARTLDVSATGEAGVDWANVGSPATAVNLSATNISTSQQVADVLNGVNVVSMQNNVITDSVPSAAFYTAVTAALWDAATISYSADGSFGERVSLIYSQELLIKAKTDNLPAAPAAVGDIPTALQNADALLNRNMSLVSDTNARTPLNALRVLRNKVSLAGTALTVTKEDDTTSAWTAVTTAAPGADPISAIDPA